MGRLGVRAHNEYTSMLASMKLVERFGEEKEGQKFQLEDGLFEGNAQGEVFREEISDSELPADSIGKMNERGETVAGVANGHGKSGGASPPHE